MIHCKMRRESARQYNTLSNFGIYGRIENSQTYTFKMQGTRASPAQFSRARVGGATETWERSGSDPAKIVLLAANSDTGSIRSERRCHVPSFRIHLCAVHVPGVRSTRKRSRGINHSVNPSAKTRPSAVSCRSLAVAKLTCSVEQERARPRKNT